MVMRQKDTMTNKIKYLLLGLVMMPLLAGCASMAEGVTNALMASPEDKEEDTRSCDVSGHAFNGLEDFMVHQEDFSSESGSPAHHPTLKVLMIHGIGTHQPG
jgi:hypothetical protein